MEVCITQCNKEVQVKNTKKQDRNNDLLVKALPTELDLLAKKV